MSDILVQMCVTLDNGETVLLGDLRYKADKDGRREEYEARRMDTLMRLGVSTRQDGPLIVNAVSVRVE